MTNIKILETFPLKVNKEVVETLKWALALAERGEVLGVSVALVTHKRETLCQISATSERHTMLASILYMLMDSVANEKDDMVLDGAYVDLENRISALEGKK